jgi:UDP-galactopyranose mutase
MIDTCPWDWVVVGAGFSGATFAREIAERGGKKVLVIDKRNHIAGNCYEETDTQTGVRYHKYGAHLFHTNSERVWDYIQNFATWSRWEHKVLANVEGAFVPVPVNIQTVNTLCKTTLTTAEEMKEWLEKNGAIGDGKAATNSEEVALARVGPVLYEKLFRPYTIKQWNREPRELKPEVLARIPIHIGHEDRYFLDRFQALPVEGYTRFVENLLNHPNIEVRVNTPFAQIRDQLSDSTHICFTGRIDEYFAAEGLPALEYRSLRFEIERKDVEEWLPNSVVNYPSLSVPYTRIHEPKHFLHQKTRGTFLMYEYPADEGEPYYPVPSERNLALYEQYKQLAAERSEQKGVCGGRVVFLGRLAGYKYINMDQAILYALEEADRQLAAAAAAVPE